MLVKLHGENSWLHVDGPFKVSIKLEDRERWKIKVELVLLFGSDSMSFTLFSGGKDIFPDWKTGNKIVEEALADFLSWVENHKERDRYDFWLQVWGMLTMQLEGAREGKG